MQATLLLITDSADDWVIFYSNEMHNCQASNEIFSLLLSYSGYLLESLGSIGNTC